MLFQFMHHRIDEEEFRYMRGDLIIKFKKYLRLFVYVQVFGGILGWPVCQKSYITTFCSFWEKIKFLFLSL